MAFLGEYCVQYSPASNKKTALLLTIFVMNVFAVVRFGRRLSASAAAIFCSMYFYCSMPWNKGYWGMVFYSFAECEELGCDAMEI